MSNITLVFAPDPAGGAYDAPPDPLPYGVSISAPWLCCHPPNTNSWLRLWTDRPTDGHAAQYEGPWQYVRVYAWDAILILL